MRRLVPVLALCALAAGVGPAAGATRECRGLVVCVPVAGPWVVVPTGDAAARPQTEYDLSCPRGYIVGGLDAELSAKEIDLTFEGRLGSPVNPGVTTTRDAVFRATKTASAPARASFRPHLGCMPANGGGGTRPPTALPRALVSLAAFPPGRPAVRHVRNVTVRRGRTQRVAVACAHGERLVGASHAYGFYTDAAPTPALAARVTVALATRGVRATVTVTNRLPAGVHAEVQVVAVCAGGE
jgi:hypothetical protein